MNHGGCEKVGKVELIEGRGHCYQDPSCLCKVLVGRGSSLYHGNSRKLIRFQGYGRVDTNPTSWELNTKKIAMQLCTYTTVTVSVVSIASRLRAYMQNNQDIVRPFHVCVCLCVCVSWRPFGPSVVRNVPTNAKETWKRIVPFLDFE